MHGLTAQIIASDTAQDRSVIAEPACHNAEICRRASQARPLRQHIPKQFPDSQDQMRLFQVRTPSGVGPRSSEIRDAPLFPTLPTTNKFHPAGSIRQHFLRFTILPVQRQMEQSS